MDEFEKGKFGFIFFFLLVIGLSVGGYYLINSDKKDNNLSINEENKLNDALKIDKNQPFIYKMEDSIINEEIPLIYEYPIINLNSDSAKSISSLLKTEISELKKDIKYQSEVEIPLDIEIISKEGNIYSAPIREYEIYEYEKYVTLVVYDYYYYCIDKSEAKKVKSYTFDTTTASLLTLNEILAIYGKNEEEIKNNIKEFLSSESTKIALENKDLVDFIEIDKSLENLTNNKTQVYYINNLGQLVTNFVVQTKENDYNDTIIFE